MAYDQYFSVLALFILFRETIEASIICGVLLQFLNRSKPGLKKAVWWGVAAGVGVSIIFGVVFIVVYYTAQSNLFKGKNRDWFKGVISWIAALLITILAFAMLRFLGWEAKWKRKLTAAIKEKVSEAVEGTEAAPLAVPIIGADGTEQPTTEKAGKVDVAQEGGRKGSSDSETATLTSDEASRFGRLGSGATARSGRVPSGAASLQPQSSIPTTLSDSSETAHDPAKKKIGSRGSATVTATAAASGAVDAGKVAVIVAGSSSGGSDAPAPAVVIDAGEPIDLTPPSRKESMKIWLLVFTTVVREGIESVVFLGGLGNVKLSAIPLPAVVGIICGVLVGVFLYYSGKQVKDIKWLVIGMSIVLFFIAAGQVNIGTDSLMKAGAFGYCSPWLDERPWYMIPMYDWSACCNDLDPTGNEPTDEQNRRRFFALTRAVFGFQDKGTPMEVMLYCGYWSIVFAIASWKAWRGELFDADYKYNRQRRRAVRAARKAAEEEAKAADLKANSLVMYMNPCEGTRDGNARGSSGQVQEAAVATPEGGKCSKWCGWAGRR